MLSSRGAVCTLENCISSSAVPSMLRAQLLVGALRVPTVLAGMASSLSKGDRLSLPIEAALAAAKATLSRPSDMATPERSALDG